MKKPLLVASCGLTLSCVVFADAAFQAPQAGSSGLTSTTASTAPATPPGLSMEEIEAWTKRELPIMGSDYVEMSAPVGTLRFGRTIQLDSATLSECRLTVRSSYQEKELKSKKTMETGTASVSATLNQVDVDKIQVQEAGVRFVKHGYLVSLFSEPDSGEPFSSTTAFNGKPGVTKQTQEVRLWLKSKDLAVQVAGVFRRAAMLCGAASQHRTAGVADPTQQADVVRGDRPSAGSKMMNEDVIQLVAAGLSEQVVITSIRQALVTSFDLTPTGLIALKKARVSDTVILAMQDHK